METIKEKMKCLTLPSHTDCTVIYQNTEVQVQELQVIWTPTGFHPIDTYPVVQSISMASPIPRNPSKISYKTF